MKLLGVMMYLALTANCGSGATRHRHETRSAQATLDYGNEPEIPEDLPQYQQSVAFSDDDSVAADNIKTVFGDNRPTNPRNRQQTRSRSNPWISRVGSGTAVRRTQLQPRAQSPCPQTPARRTNPVYYPPPMPSFNGYPSLPWWPSWGGFQGFPVYIPVPVPVPVCNCTTQDERPSSINGRGSIPNQPISPPFVEYDDIDPAPLDFTPATTSRPLGFDPPSVDRRPSANNPVQNQQVPEVPQQPERPRRPTTSGAKTNRKGEPRCARAIVNCCDLEADLKCFELFGCGGAIFGDPCVYYETALNTLLKYENNNQQ